MKPHHLLLLAAAPITVLADYTDDLNQALRRFGEHKSYAWETLVEPADVPVVKYSQSESPTPTAADSADLVVSPTRTMPHLITVPISGITDKDVSTLLTTTTGSLVTPSSGPLGLTQETGVRAVIRGNQRVAEFPEGWLNELEIAHRARIVPPVRQRRPTPPGVPDEAQERIAMRHQAVAMAGVYHAGQFMISLVPPAEELRRLLAGANAPMQVGKTIVATLSEATAIKVVHDLRFREGPFAVDGAPSTAEGAVTIWLKNGEVSKYEIVVRFDAASRSDSSVVSTEPVKLVKTTSIQRFDVSPPKIPRDALAKLSL